uniref:Uncharacterized protein n=1 Tax=Eutreptiella gymnastica TaxID=73025 RepID=A0A7S1J8R7_9EUGL
MTRYAALQLPLPSWHSKTLTTNGPREPCQGAGAQAYKLEQWLDNDGMGRMTNWTGGWIPASNTQRGPGIATPDSNGSAGVCCAYTHWAKRLDAGKPNAQQVLM